MMKIETRMGMKMNIKVEIKMKRILLGKLTRWEREEGKKMTTIE